MTSKTIQVGNTDKHSEPSEQGSDDFIVTDKSDSSNTASQECDSDSTGIVIDIFDDSNDSPCELTENLGSTKKEIGTEDLTKQLCVYNEFKSPEDSFVLNKLAFDYDKHLSRSEFKDLAAKTGFSFGETFSLIQQAWSTEKRALTRLELNEAIYKTLDNYIVHPCIIDACLQSCIAIGSNDPERQVIPIGKI